MSKGDKRRPGKPGAYEAGYSAIDWSRGRPAPVAPKPDVGAVLLKDYAVARDGWELGPLHQSLQRVQYVIRFDDGSYNLHLGHQATIKEASRYDTIESAQAMADRLMGVAAIEDEIVL